MMTGYKLGSYASERGARAALIVGDTLYDAADVTGRSDYAHVTAILDEWDDSAAVFGRVVDAREAKGVPLTEVKFLAPVLYPHAVYCTGANYQDHVDAVARHHGFPPQPSAKSLGVGPFFFMKAPRTIVAPIAEVVNESRAFDYEIELAVVIGRPTRGVSAAEALNYVAGYTIANDLSARDRIMRPQLPEGSPFRYDWGSHKNFDGACPMGPWIVPAADIGDPQALSLKTWVNGELRQDSTTAKMLYSIGEQIEMLSRFTTLYPGDVLLTGTPEGVGAETGRWIDKGDVVRMAIGGIGEIATTIV